MGSISYTINTAVEYFFLLLYVLIFIRVILSWVPMNTRSNPLLAVVYTLTDPILGPIRKMLQKSPLGGRGMMLDFSPFFALFILQLVKMVIQYFLNMIFSGGL